MQEADIYETDVTEWESGAETDAEELEEHDCQETKDSTPGMNIEHGQNVEQAASQIRSDLVSNAVNVATVIDKGRNIASMIRKSPVKTMLCRVMRNPKIVTAFTCYLIARQDAIA